MSAKKPLKYREGWHVEDKVILPDYAFTSVMTTHTKRYHNCLYLLAGLSRGCRNLMDYIAEQMDADNVFYSNEYFRNSFKNFMEKNASFDKKTDNGIVEVALNYSDESIKKWLGTLVAKNLIRPIKRGVYKVNPEYFWKNEDGERDKVIVMELEFRSKVDTKLKILQEETGIEKVVEN